MILISIKKKTSLEKPNDDAIIFYFFDDKNIEENIDSKISKLNTREMFNFLIAKLSNTIPL